MPVFHTNSRVFHVSLSIVQSDATHQRRSRAHELLNWARDEEDNGLRSLIPSEPPNTSPSAGAQREMEELERWLADKESRMQSTRTRHSAPISFDNNFTDSESVSAPSPWQPSAGMLLPMHTGASYCSLASLSDFGEASLPMPDSNGDEEDSDLSSRAEIVEMSRQIVGAHHADDDEFKLSVFDLSQVPTP
ncbi:hypothetical protein B0H21DRAFT_851231 [Amylocystis lapponica]|nr:hypothetical protein B0H21DRAFT_851231 [Amylocystis lapponica]